MRQAGFTLLELLVGLVVLGFIMAGLTQGVRYGLRAADAQSRLVDGRSELDSVDRALRRLLTQADPGSGRTGPTLRGTEGRIEFVSALPDAAAALPDQPASMALGLAGNRLLLRWSPRLHAKRLEPAAPPRETELLRGVRQIELAYWGSGWQRGWDQAVLPGLIRLRITFPPGDPRHWPDIVAAPLRGRIQ